MDFLICVGGWMYKGVMDSRMDGLTDGRVNGRVERWI